MFLEEMATVGTTDKRSQILTIVGEQVSLLPTGLAGVDNIIVSFDDKYKPTNITKEDEDLLKKTLQRLFSGSGVYFGNPSPNPPCNKKEKDLVLKSLTYRFKKLRALVSTEKQRDSLYFRQSLKHLFDLQGYINWFEKAPCSDGKDGEFTGTLGILTDDQIKMLLKQFIFLMLQGQHPLPGYEKQDPNPAAFIGRLEKGAIPDFKEFIKKYQGENHQIPERIAKVMEVADLDLEVLRKQIDARVAESLKEIIKVIFDAYPDPNDPIWGGIDKDHPTTETLIKLVKSLLSRIADAKRHLDAANAELKTTKLALEECQKSIAGKNDEIKVANDRATMADARLKDLEAKVAEGATGAEALKASLDEANKTIAIHIGTIQRLEAEKKLLEEQNKELLLRLDKLEAEIVTLRKEIELLTANCKKAQGVEKDTTELTTQINTLQAEKDKLQKELQGVEEIRNKIIENQRLILEKDNLIKKLTNENDEKTKIIGSLEQQLEDALAAKKKYEDDLEASERRLRQLSDEYVRDTTKVDKEEEEAAEQVEDFKNKLNEANKRIKEIQDELEREKAKGVGKDAAAVGKDRIISELEDELEREKARHVGNDDAAEENDRRIRELEEELEREKAKGVGKDAAAVGKDRIIEQLEEEIEALKAENRDLAVAATAAGSAASQSETTLKNELAKVKKELIAAQNAASTATAAATKANTDLTDAKAAAAAAATKANTDLADAKTAATTAATEAKNIIETLQRQIAALQTQLTTGQGDDAKLRKEIEDLKKALAEAKAAATTAATQAATATTAATTAAAEVTRLQGEGRTKDKELKTTKDDYARLLRLVREVKTWVEEGVRNKEPFMITAENNNKNPVIKELVDNISRLPLMSPEDENKELEENMNRCYLVFFASYLWSRHFPQKPERGFDQFKNEVMAAIKGCLYGIHKGDPDDMPVEESRFETLSRPRGRYRDIEAITDQPDIDGMYAYVENNLIVAPPPGIKPLKASMFMLNAITKILYEMENIHSGDKQKAYYLYIDTEESKDPRKNMEGFLTPKEIKAMEELNKIANSVIPRKLTDFTKFQERLKWYMAHRSSENDKDLTNLSLQFEKRGGKTYPVIVYADDAKEIQKLEFTSIKALQDYLKNGIQPKKDTKILPPESTQMIKNNMLSFAFLLYVNLFVFKDYLNEIEADKLCPRTTSLPKILQK